MNGEVLLRKIDEIDDTDILHSETMEKRKPSARKKLALWLAPVAACLCVIIGIAVFFKSAGPINIPDTHVISTVYYFNGDLYERLAGVEGVKITKEKGLATEPSDEMIGKYIGEAETMIDNEKAKVAVYEYRPLNGTSVVLGKFEGDYFYLLYCNPVEGGIDIDALLEKYGMASVNDISRIEVGTQVITDSAEIAKFIGHFKTLSTEEYDELLFSGLTEEEKVELLNKLADHSADIIISGEGSDTLKLTYYPEYGVAHAANTNYLLVPEN